MTAERGAPVRLSGEYQGRPGAVLARLQELYPALIDLSLGRLEALLAKLGNPERHLPPVIHVAGTNGKGSTCANLRAIAEAGGLRVHVMSSPHLVSVTERFRLAGRLVDEDVLVAALEKVEQVNAGAPITVFEVLTAAGFLLFSQVPADLVVLEVGLGGRLDATNVVPKPAACVITPVSLDHEAFLGSTVAAIAGEKAGIIKEGVPVVSAAQVPEALDVIRSRAAELNAPLRVIGQDVVFTERADGLEYRDADGALSLPLPALKGRHQAGNAALAVAALRVSGVALPLSAYQGIARTFWPARLQKLDGTLAQMLPAGWELYLDGGHNPDAGQVLGTVLDDWKDRPVHVIAGVKQTKDASGFLKPIVERAASVQAVAEPGQHLAMPVEEIIAASGGRAIAGPTVREALGRLVAEGGAPARVLICGSLYLAGVVLAEDGWIAR
ncbi:bifunctional folylpolyglutamate synthase/dihydrofolate synthase [Gluconobacter roseus]|uniref:Dihydrofolate synthase/folylpolyglutamate synthase n=1 Tax=Gluconobacter roseus NBRC 3990 TaxID=1307950 RepID=A0A4Y3M8M1_9PROT|nr:folylpolyglutamate synthase/dihydrofolate synthase family protein [Gluconobacter roseus]KXV44948.1 folylpolyglutamate synthase [Gluconobacter roseus]GBR46348.1 bifunctional protein FolC [Gluconobacter roseus NBRC 3990]GEB04893.1 bifunctional folylpolyglutamate synthase/dihydrofolate synthase [Gluconobacter roseus NBRC 3990]GLP94561.1 bifunctional folylpolyglutamate synthase/dihydrofolate synthase [Gluconobacter roseus NBRC 3990]